MRHYVLAVTGASGSVYARRAMQLLADGSAAIAAASGTELAFLRVEDPVVLARAGGAEVPPESEPRCLLEACASAVGAATPEACAGPALPPPPAGDAAEFSVHPGRPRRLTIVHPKLR